MQVLFVAIHVPLHDNCSFYAVGQKEITTQWIVNLFQLFQVDPFLYDLKVN